MGLATARLLQERGKAVTLYARELPPKTTSNIAPAQWAPHGLLGGTFERRVETLEPDTEATERIFRRAQTFFDRMGGRMA